MNARQKAKYYKRKYEELSNKTVEHQIAREQPSIVALKAEQIINNDDFTRLSAVDDQGLSMINKMLASELFHNLLYYAKVERYDDCYVRSTVVRATIKVVDMNC